MKNYVYWMHDQTCTDPYCDGYVGVTYDINARANKHRRSSENDVPSTASVKILFEGTRRECFEEERRYRPHKNIGWNNAAGGSHGWRLGFTHSEQTKEKLKDAWANNPSRKEKAKEQASKMSKLNTGNLRPDHSKQMSGVGNPMFGKTHSEEAKLKMSKNSGTRGKTPHNYSRQKCEFCGVLVSKSIMKKYHGIGKKNCIAE